MPIYPNSLSKRSVANYAAIFVCVSVPATVAAQDLGRPPQTDTGEAAPDHVILGFGAGYVPVYQGSDKYRVLPLPVIDVDVGPFYANVRNGIGVSVIDSGPVTLGGGVAMMPGYRRKDVPDGIGKLTIGAGGRMFASVRTNGIIATIGATKGFAGGTKGVIADASLSSPVKLSSRAMIIPTIMLTWADSKHNDRYFGVSEGQSLASGLPEFTVGSGFKDVSANVTMSYRLTSRINLGISGGVTTLFEAVADSPLAERQTQPFGFLTAGYRF